MLSGAESELLHWPSRNDWQLMTPKKPENDDGLLISIYEAERGLINAVRLLQRAARSR